MLKYLFRIKTTLLDTFRGQRSPLRLNLGKTSYKQLVLVRIEFLKLIRAPTESLRLIILNYMFKYTFGIKTTSLESLRKQKGPLKARFRHNLSKRIRFCA